MTRLAKGLAQGVARMQPGGRVLRTRAEGEWTWIEIEKLRIWDVIEIG